MNSYPLGATVRASVAFAVNGTATDPTTLTAKVRTSAGVVTSYVYNVDAALKRDSVGNYHLDIPTTASGVWSYRFIATGTAAGANEAEFYVQPSDFGTGG